MIRKISKKRIIIVVCITVALLPIVLVAGDYYRQVKLRDSVERILSAVKSAGVIDASEKDSNGCRQLPVGYTSITACYRGFDFHVTDVSRSELETLVSYLHKVISKELPAERNLELGTALDDNTGNVSYKNRYSVDGNCGLTYWFSEAENYGNIYFSCNDTTELSKLFNLWGIRQNI